MTDNEKLSCLIDRPCNACKFHKEEGCSKWSCVFEEKSGVPKGEYIKKDERYRKRGSMSDTVKLIIEIPTGGAFERDIYTPICAEGFIRDEYNEKVAEAIKNGIPLDDVKAKMQKLADEPWNMTFGSASQGLESAIEILDYIGKEREE